jgi:hypothetical protein
MADYFLPAVPDDWSNPEARAEFFARLPKPLVVLIACDLAALTPHGALGLKAIDSVRLWLVGQVEKADLRTMWERIWQVVMDERYQQMTTHRVALDAVLAAVTTDAAYWAKDISSPSVLDRRSAPSDAAAHYRRHRRVVEEIMRCAADPTVRQILAVAYDDPHVRPLLWDAMLEAGYSPIEPPRKLPWRERLAKHWQAFWRR